MSGTRFQNIICYSLLALVFLLSLILRIAVPWDHVFSGTWIKFTDNDAYFYVRLLDNLARPFPSLGGLDPYYIYPDGIGLGGRPLFFVYLMGFIAWLLGGGTPSQHTVDLVGVLFPAVTGALLVFPVFLIGRAAFNKWAGLVAAGFIALMPGEFLVRTLLGNTDSHALEILLSTLFMLFLLLSVKSGKALDGMPDRAGLKKFARPLIYGALAGLSLGFYLLSWAGALLFVFISFTWLALQFIADYLCGRPSGYLAVTGLSTFIVALLMSLTMPGATMTWISLAVAALSSLALAALSALMRKGRLAAPYYPLTAVTLAGAGLWVAFIISPQFMGAALNTLTNFFSWTAGAGIAETQPLLIQQGSFTFALVWGNYTAASVMALAALSIVIYRAFRRGEPEILLLVVWSIVALLSALAMRRFAYYLAINAAVLAGYTGWLVLSLCGLSEGGSIAAPLPADKKGKGKKGVRKRQRAGNIALMAAGIAAVAFAVIYPNTGPLPGGDKPFFDVATRALYTPSNAWCQSMDWLRDQTEQPFREDGYYYDYYGALPGKTAVYSVLCWWDYGYWVTRIGQRVPLSNPGSAQVGEQMYFTASGGQEAAQFSAAWNMRYVVVNDYMVNWNTGFRVIASDAYQKAAKYFEVYYRLQKDKLAPTLLYYPEYYRTMAVRLYCFDAKAYTPVETAVISWEAKTGADGYAYKEITGLQTFRIYEEAEAFLAAQKTGNWRIVGKYPLASPVPLEALEGYRPAFASSQKARVGNNEIAEVKIFEYNP
jgi:dolichyl-diphosphooligosaccharide--protein glycosyltransferase